MEESRNTDKGCQLGPSTATLSGQTQYETQFAVWHELWPLLCAAAFQGWVTDAKKWAKIADNDDNKYQRKTPGMFTWH